MLNLAVTLAAYYAYTAYRTDSNDRMAHRI
mgnify:CR=1 FL=1